MPGPTLAQMAADALRLQQFADDAARAGLRVDHLITAGGYALVFAASSDSLGDVVVKIPWVPWAAAAAGESAPAGAGPCLLELSRAGGPYVLRGLRTPAEAAQVLERGIDRERVGAPPLIRALAALSLGGLPAALYQRVPGDSLRTWMRHRPDAARALLPAIAQALVELHSSFGFHGDLEPEHVFVTADAAQVTFIDPIDARTASAELVGTVGYVLPLRPWRGGLEVRDEMLLMRDVGALAAMTAEAWGGSLGWDGRVAHLLVNQGHGRFGAALDAAGFVAGCQRGLDPVPYPHRTWIEEVCQQIADVAIVDPGRPGMLARLASGSALPRGTARGLLWRLAALAGPPDAFESRRLHLLCQSVDGMVQHAIEGGGAGPIGLLWAAEHHADRQARERILGQPYLRAQADEGFARCWRLALDLEWLLGQYVGALPRAAPGSEGVPPDVGPAGAPLRSFVRGVMAYIDLVRRLDATSAAKTAQSAAVIAALLRRSRAALAEPGVLAEAVREYAAFLRR